MDLIDLDEAPATAEQTALPATSFRYRFPTDKWSGTSTTSSRMDASSDVERRKSWLILKFEPYNTGLTSTSLVSLKGSLCPSSVNTGISPRGQQPLRQEEQFGRIIPQFPFLRYRLWSRSRTGLLRRTGISPLFHMTRKSVVDSFALQLPSVTETRHSPHH